MDRIKQKKFHYQKRKKRIRKKIFGTSEIPRLSVYRSLKHIYAQVIDDANGHTIAAASTLSAELRGALDSTENIAAAARVGQLIAEKAKTENIEKVVFDRGANLYHGRVKALADGARKGGLKF